MNILMLTSCNRIKQVLLSLSLNYQTIKGPFAVVIVDNSTPEVTDPHQGDRMHQVEDPYNVVKSYNYCSDINLLYDAKKYFPNLTDYVVLHCHPRLVKQRGEATMVGLGLMQAALIGNRTGERSNFCVKLTGTSILRYDVMPEVRQGLENKDVMTWHRANIGGDERSTRVLACRPEKLIPVIGKRGWYDWVDDNSGVFEQRWARYLLEDLGEDRIHYTRNDDASVLLEGGMAMQQSYGRERITAFIQQNNIKVNGNPYIEQFLNGEIW